MSENDPSPENEWTARYVILDLVATRTGVSFAEVINELDRRHIEHQGDRAIANDAMWEKNLLCWTGMNEAFMKDFVDLHSNQIIQLDPTHWLVYMTDGMFLDMPIAKQNRKYKEMHWIPTVINKGANWAAAKPDLDLIASLPA